MSNDKLKEISWFKLFDKFIEKNKNKVHEPKVQIRTIGYDHGVEYIQSLEVEVPNTETLINIEPTIKGKCTINTGNIDMNKVDFFDSAIIDEEDQTKG